ncbi:hypothetical protein ACFQZ4_02105 [Catellatospora coxensis]
MILSPDGAQVRVLGGCLDLHHLTVAHPGLGRRCRGPGAARRGRITTAHRP